MEVLRSGINLSEDPVEVRPVPYNEDINKYYKLPVAGVGISASCQSCHKQIMFYQPQCRSLADKKDDAHTFSVAAAKKKCPWCSAGMSKVKLANLYFRDCHYEVEFRRVTEDDNSVAKGSHTATDTCTAKSWKNHADQLHIYEVVDITCWRG